VANIKISLMNRSTVLTDAQVQAAVPSLQKQVHRDFAPVWGVDADLVFVGRNANPQSGTWWLGVFDNSDVADALGYHDLTQDGLPIGKIFAGTDLQVGASWTVTASHELLEMLGDPDINLTALVQDSDTSGTLFAYEVCDACEADEFGYKIDGVLVSDFVYPAWFESFRAENSSQFDHGKQITQPFALLPGGYIGVFDIASGTGWSQRQMRGAEFRPEMRGRLGSRRERRKTIRQHWLRSTPDAERQAKYFTTGA
jgi:hypothetical protein